MRVVAVLLVLWGSTCCSVAACQEDAQGAVADAYPHQHGVARLQIVVEVNRLHLRLRAPLESLLGFEHPPRTRQQREAVRTMADQLHQPQRLFIPAAPADCTSTRVVLMSDGLTSDMLAPDPMVETAAAAVSPGHADLDAEFSFACGKPLLLTGLQVQLFDMFSGLRQIDVEIVTPRGQSGVRLSPDRTSLTW